MNLQPGKGYNFASSSMGVTMDTSNPFPDPDGSAGLNQQFQCKVESETTAGTTKFYLKTRKGVCNYTWSQFPFHPDPVSGFAFRTYEKQARITDWAVYQNGKRTAGTATDGEAFEWMGADGKIELPTGASGASVLVLISKIDWWDKELWLQDYRLIDAEKPFVSVVSTADTTAIGTLTTQQGNTAWAGPAFYQSNTPSTNWTVSYGPPYPLLIGYTFKKIAQLDWNDTTNSWDVTQYEIGPIDLPIQHFMWPATFEFASSAPTPSLYETYFGTEFDNCLNYSWFEGTWAITGYTMNPSNWWYDLVDA